MRTIVTLAAATLLATSLDGAAQTPPCGSTLYASVTLTSDLVCPGGTALTVGADNVRIKLDGYSILGGPFGSGAGVRASGVNAVEIVGPGRIDFFTAPIEITGGSGHVIRYVRIDQPGKVTLRNVYGSLVEGNRFSHLALVSDPGQLAPKNQVLRNEVGGVYPGLIELRGCGTVDTLVAENTIDSLGQAIVILEGPQRNRIVANNIKAAFAGIVLGSASYNSVEYNKIEVTPGSGWGVRIYAYGHAIACAGGILDASSNTVVKNELDGGHAGISFGGAGGAFARENLAKDNVLRNHSLAALAFTAGADDNDARGNVYPTPPAFIDWGRGNLWP